MNKTKKDLNKDLYYVIERLHNNYYGNIEDITCYVEEICNKSTKDINEVRDLHGYINPNWTKEKLQLLLDYLSSQKEIAVQKVLDEVIEMDL